MLTTCRYLLDYNYVGLNSADLCRRRRPSHFPRYNSLRCLRVHSSAERHKRGTRKAHPETHQLASHQVAQSPPPQREQLTTFHTLQKPTSRKKLASTHTTSRHSETHWTYTNVKIAAHACQDWEIYRSQCPILLQRGTRETQGRHAPETHQLAGHQLQQSPQQELGIHAHHTTLKHIGLTRMSK